jgi:hypothetical protein
MKHDCKNIPWDKYEECGGDDVTVRQKKIRAMNSLRQSSPCVGSKHQMRMCQRSEDPITDLDGIISIKNDSLNGNRAGSIHPTKNIGQVMCEVPKEKTLEKNCFLIYFLLFVLISIMCGCSTVLLEDKKYKNGGSEYVNYTDSDDFMV